MEVSPGNCELYHLHILLRHVRGTVSFNDLNTVQGIRQNSFYDACKELHLIDTTNEITSKYPSCWVQRMFALICCICLECQIMEFLLLFEFFIGVMVNDYWQNDHDLRHAVNKLFAHINSFWGEVAHSCTNFTYQSQWTLGTFLLQMRHQRHSKPIHSPVRAAKRWPAPYYNTIIAAVHMVLAGNIQERQFYYTKGCGGTWERCFYTMLYSPH